MKFAWAIDEIVFEDEDLRVAGGEGSGITGHTTDHEKAVADHEEAVRKHEDAVRKRIGLSEDEWKTLPPDRKQGIMKDAVRREENDKRIAEAQAAYARKTPEEKEADSKKVVIIGDDSTGADEKRQAHIDLVKKEGIVRGWVGSPHEEFQDSISEELNNGLRGVSKLEPHQNEFAKELKALIKKEGDVTTKDIVLYRGLSVGLTKKLKAGTTFQDKGFASLTTSEEVADLFSHGANTYGEGPAGKVFEVHIPKGTTLLDVQKILKEDSSSSSSEREHLLSTGTKFKVVSVGKKNILKIVK